jgi:hypothetical protein
MKRREVRGDSLVVESHDTEHEFPRVYAKNGMFVDIKNTPTHIREYAEGHGEVTAILNPDQVHEIDIRVPEPTRPDWTETAYVVDEYPGEVVVEVPLERPDDVPRRDTMSAIDDAGISADHVHQAYLYPVSELLEVFYDTSNEGMDSMLGQHRVISDPSNIRGANAADWMVPDELAKQLEKSPENPEIEETKKRMNPMRHKEPEEMTPLQKLVAGHDDLIKDDDDDETHICGVCGDKFEAQHKKYEHEVKEHGVDLEDDDDEDDAPEYPDSGSYSA